MLTEDSEPGFEPSKLKVPSFDDAHAPDKYKPEPKV